jgi:hypothetical protein
MREAVAEAVVAGVVVVAVVVVDEAAHHLAMAHLMQPSVH